MRPRIVWTIFRKEITEALRDRVTLFVVVVLPLLVYPLAVMLLGRIAQRQVEAEEQRASNVAVWSAGGAPLLDWLKQTNMLAIERWQGIPQSLRADFEAGRVTRPAQTNAPAAPAKPLLRSKRIAPSTGTEDAVLRAAREVVSGKQTDAVLVIWPGFEESLQRHERGSVSIYYDSVRPGSAKAWSRLSTELYRFRAHLVQDRQRERGLPEGFSTALEIHGDNVAPPRRQFGDVLGRLLPLLLIMLSTVGALYAAVDLTAGEKDRATMQTLLCAPVQSLEIVAGKFLTVWTIGLVAAAANIVSLGFTFGRLAASVQLPSAPIGTMIAVLGLLLPATCTVSALFMAVAVLARDAKDAGNFLSAMMMVVILPVAATMMPGVELNPWTCFVPLVNLSLLIRAMLLGEATANLVFLTLLASAAYALLALRLAAHAFAREQILLGGQGSWRGLLTRGPQRENVPTPGLALSLFALVMVVVFYGSLTIEKSNLALSILVVEYVFFLLPVVAVTAVRKFPIVPTFSLRPPQWRSVVGCVLIGVSAAVGAAGLTMRLLPPPESLVRGLEEVLMLGNKPAPLWEVWLVIGLSPALCEEAFFRGLVLSGLRRWGPWAAIGVSSLLFAVAHASIYRLLPTLGLGLILGLVLWRTGSIYCSMLVHALNNGLIATLARQPGLAERFGLGEMQFVPWSWTAIALVVTAVGLLLLVGPKRRSQT